MSLWKQLREYKEDAPLYARRDLKFSGRAVNSGEQVLEDYFRSKTARLQLWRVDHVSHLRKPKTIAALARELVTTPSNLVVADAIETKTKTAIEVDCTVPNPVAVLVDVLAFTAAAESLATSTEPATSTPVDAALIDATLKQIDDVLAAPIGPGATMKPLAPKPQGNHRRGR